MKTIRAITTCMIIILACLPTLNAQEYDNVFPTVVPGAIPSSPAFGLLGVNPESVMRPSDVKEFKVDWRIKNYKIAPDLALELQPLWWFHYRNRGLQAYKDASPLERILSTMSLSLATAKLDGVNHMGVALKFNLYKEKDPYLQSDTQKNYEDRANLELASLHTRLDSLLHAIDLMEDSQERKKLKYELMNTRIDIKQVHQNIMDDAQLSAEDFARENWNMDMVDVAFGQVYKYDNGGLDSLKFKTAGYGIWINAAKRVSKNGLLTGLLRMNHVGNNNDYMLGASFRYGSNRFNFFLELVMNRYGNSFDNGFSEEEIFAGKREVDLGNAWYEFGEGDPNTSYTISYGGDFRLSKKVLLNFALRTQVKAEYGFERFVPVANVVCLMN